MTATTINRTPFRKVFDIPAHLLISDRLKWESTQGTVALTTNGTRFAHVNDGKLGYWWTTKEAYINPWPPRTFIIVSPPGRRKYVKLLLKRLGYRNVDKIPTTDKQTPFDLGRSLPDHERENLLAIAPGIVLRDVL